MPTNHDENPFLVWYRATGEDVWASRVEACGWIQLLFALLSQLSYFSPGYNCGIALCGIYCEFSRKRKVVFTYIVILVFSICIDIVISGTYGPNVSESYTKEGASAGGAHNFGLGLLVLLIFVKIWTTVCTLRLLRHLPQVKRKRSSVDSSSSSVIAESEMTQNPMLRSRNAYWEQSKSFDIQLDDGNGKGEEEALQRAAIEAENR
eukprot:g220.t1